jgi:hypothetical protein
VCIGRKKYVNRSEPAENYVNRYEPWFTLTESLVASFPQRAPLGDPDPHSHRKFGNNTHLYFFVPWCTTNEDFPKKNGKGDSTFIE